MTVETVVYILLAILIVVALAYAAKYVIDTFFPAPMHTPALLLVGVVLLLVLVLMVLRMLPPGTIR